MEGKEFNFKGMQANGFLMLFVDIALIIGGILLMVSTRTLGAAGLLLGLLLLVVACFMWAGFMSQEPNEARAMVFFGKYKGTFRSTGFFWVNPFLNKKKLSLRARNLDVEPIKVNDKTGNPIMIGLVLVWRLKDTYKAMFEIDSQTMATVSSDSTPNQKG